LQTIRYYAEVGGKVSPKLLSDWKHFEQVGFPAELNEPQPEPEPAAANENVEDEDDDSGQ